MHLEGDGHRRRLSKSKDQLLCARRVDEEEGTDCRELSWDLGSLRQQLLLRTCLLRRLLLLQSILLRRAADSSS